VFNLDSIAIFGWKMYAGFRKACIKQMLTDSKAFPQGDTWQNRAQGFNRFEPDRGRTKPSEWYILLFFLMYLFGRRLKPGRIEDTGDDGSSASSTSTGSAGSSSEEISPEGGSEGSAESTRGGTWKRWILALFRRSEKGEKDGPDSA